MDQLSTVLLATGIGSTLKVTGLDPSMSVALGFSTRRGVLVQSDQELPVAFMPAFIPEVLLSTVQGGAAEPGTSLPSNGEASTQQRPSPLQLLVLSSMPRSRIRTLMPIAAALAATAILPAALAAIWNPTPSVWVLDRMTKMKSQLDAGRFQGPRLQRDLARDITTLDVPVGTRAGFAACRQGRICGWVPTTPLCTGTSRPSSWRKSL